MYNDDTAGQPEFDGTARNSGRAIGLSLNSAETLALLLESAPVAIVTVDKAGHILFVNSRFLEMFGYRHDELIGQKLELLMPPRFRHIHVQHRTEYVANPRIRPMGSGLNLVARHKDGTEFPVEVGLSHIELQGELLVTASLINVAIRKDIADVFELRVEQRTREIERRRRVAAGLRDMLAVLNSNRSLDEILDYIVSQAIELLDNAGACAVYRLHELAGQFVIRASYGLPAEYVVQANLPLAEGAVGKALETRQPVAISDLRDVEHVAPGSRARREALLKSGYCAFLAVPLTIKDEVYGSLVLYYNKPVEFTAEAFDLALTFSDHAALAIENARLRTQVEHAAVLAERSRIARDLHDAVTQTLFSASLIAEVLPRLWRRDRSEAERRLGELRQLTRGALAEMRTLLLELRPSRLIDVALGDLLRQLAEAITGRTRVPIEIIVDGQCPLPPDRQVALYRIAQEALNNVAKHARAHQAEVKLCCRPERVELTVSDDGLGFNFEGVKPENLGLSIMHERAEAIGAKLDIQTQLGYGTRVVVVWEDIKKTQEASNNS